MKESDGKVETSRERKDEEVKCVDETSLAALHLQRLKGNYRLLQ